MESNERTPILEPLLLILKQRTGVATVIGVIVAVVLYLMGFPSEVIQSVVALVFVYVGGQKWVDGKESATPVINFTDNYRDELDFIKDQINKTNKEVEKVTEVVAQVVEERARD